MKLNELLDLWLNKYAKLSLKVRSYNKYLALIKLHINPILGECNIIEISSNDIQDFIIEKLQKGNLRTGKPLAINTIYSIISILKQSFKLALMLELIAKNPMTSIKLPSCKEKEIMALTREEQQRIVDYCLKSRKNNYIGIILCLYTGIRLGELLALTWEDINFKNGFLTIKKTAYTTRIKGKNEIVVDTPKTKRSNRVIPLPNKLIQLLKHYQENAKCNYVIYTNKYDMVETRSFQRSFESILRKCNIQHYNFHCLRHTFATRALELGIDIKTLSEILGHTNVAITLNRYAHSLLEYKVQEMNKIEQIL